MSDTTQASSIIGPDKLIEINNALDHAEEALKELDLAKRAGYDVADLETKLTDNIARLRQIKSVYFPNSP